MKYVSNEINSILNLLTENISFLNEMYDEFDQKQIIQDIVPNLSLASVLDLIYDLEGKDRIEKAQEKFLDRFFH